ncbi:hypothetical protein HY489_04705 [Candidatus Woesearchaeota archaeon]|nr:hypothetical protein [Candidatus Woesearchaeota archaeon]
MKIMICGSMTFAKNMIETKQLLEKQGHTVLLPCDAELHAERPTLIDNLDEDAKHLKENDVLRNCFQRVADSEAIIFLNHEKNGMQGYIGTSCLMELGIAYHLGKKLFLLNDIPHSTHARWTHEVRVMEPTILHGDLSLIK